MSLNSEVLLLGLNSVENVSGKLNILTTLNKAMNAERIAFWGYK